MCPAGSRKHEHPHVVSAKFARERIYEALVQLFVSSGTTYFICLYWLLPSHSQDFHRLLRHPLHLFIFSGGTRELPGKEEGQVAPAGMTALFWGGSAGCECSAESHGI